MERYIPPYEITEDMLGLVTDIVELLGKISFVDNLSKLPSLRRVNRIKSIQSSLDIENNTLTIEQVTAILYGKRVLAPQKDILEASNALEAYKQSDGVDPYKIDNLLKIHKIMMQGLVEEAGQLRSTLVGVVKEDGEVVHVGPPSDLVPKLLDDLFTWVNESKLHMLIKSCIFHYEFEFIHPFRDGNGRMGRLWQTVLLADWKRIFAYIPIESIIKNNQQEYYDAITLSTADGKSNKFILFMLETIKQAVEVIVIDSRKHLSHSNEKVSALLAVMDDYPMTAKELMARLNLKSRDGFRRNYLVPAVELGAIRLVDFDKPTSKNQKYIKN